MTYRWNRSENLCSIAIRRLPLWINRRISSLKPKGRSVRYAK